MGKGNEIWKLEDEMMKKGKQCNSKDQLLLRNEEGNEVDMQEKTIEKKKDEIKPRNEENQGSKLEMEIKSNEDTGEIRTNDSEEKVNKSTKGNEREMKKEREDTKKKTQKTK